MYNGGVWIRRRSDGIDVFESRQEPLLYVLHKGRPSDSLILNYLIIIERSYTFHLLAINDARPLGGSKDAQTTDESIQLELDYFKKMIIKILNAMNSYDKAGKVSSFPVLYWTNFIQGTK